ncbi:MAG: outer membrane beta-barrel protein [Saprospiraceae bacterium]|nr:outer membrane beta-barrel protein [Saprospiraceae bacterium]
MKTHNIQNKLKPIIIWLIFIGMVSTGQSQKNNLQFQIGGQIMQNYNLGGLIDRGLGYGAYHESRQSVATTFNQDVSVSLSFNKHHSVILGGGFYTTCRRIDAVTSDDTRNKNYFYDVKPCYENYSVYMLYQFTHWLAPTLNIHASLGPMWAKNHNQVDWFFVPVKLSYFSGIGKIGVQYKLSDHLSLELNGMAVRSLTNIVEVSQGTTGSIIPFLVGLDLRVGYQF